jgi:tetratricopeptide (TPR) repeat protein
VIYGRQGNYTQGREYARRAAEIAPATIQRNVAGLTQFYRQHPTAKGYIKLCLLFDNAGRIEDARAACKKAADIEPHSDEAQRILDHVNQE